MNTELIREHTLKTPLGEVVGASEEYLASFGNCQGLIRDISMKNAQEGTFHNFLWSFQDLILC